MKEQTSSSVIEQTVEEIQTRLTSRPAELRGLASRPSEGEPIAIVGLSCRFPKAPNAEAFWRLLRDGVDAITEVPKERWDVDALYDADPSAPGKMNTRWGGFLEQVDRFDPGFFGISPREAVHLDPQQRLMLELSWEALEDAGLLPDGLEGSPTGVFFGAMSHDYAKISGGQLDAIGQHTATGQDLSIIPARISYALGLQGPSLLVNTASSSSLVAVHLGCQSLRSGESTLALCGGVNLILSPESTIAMSKLGTMAPDGRSKAFDARANGYVRGEGGGVVVLKPLSLALAHGDPIYCVIRGSAVNNDGFSNGLTAPSSKAQEAVLREAYARAGVTPADVHYVEAHGTGTILGDPIEARALGAVLGAGRPAERPLRLGSVKTNIGHLEAAAGIAGLIKVALAARRLELPPSLHFQTPSPHIPFDELRLQVQQTLEAWPGSSGRALAGVSSFGFGGTNCHVVIEGACTRPVQLEPKAPSLAAAPPELLVLSARSLGALEAMAGAMSAWLTERRDLSLNDLCYTASVRRDHHEHRLAAVGRTHQDLSASLSSFVRGEAPPSVASGRARPGPRPKVVFVYPGQGSQWVGMGRALLEEEPVFRAAIEACDALVKRYADFSLLDELLAPPATSRLGETEVTQPTLFAMEVALSELWASWGVLPDAVVGHSVGEVAAAHVAGALSLEDAVRLVCHRGRVMQPAAGLGRMAAVALSVEEASALVQGYEDRLSIAAINDPGSVVLSGEAEALEGVVERLQRQQVHCQMLRVNYAFHSPQMAPFQGELSRSLGRLDVKRPALAMYSTVLGATIEGAELDAAYWARNIREPVQFARAIRASIDDGHRLFLDVGPHPVLTSNLKRCFAEGTEGCHVIPTLRREQEERRALLESLGALYAHGYAVDFQRLYPSGGRCVPLPTYPFQRERYWIEAAAPGRGAPERLRTVPPGGAGHPLLGASFSVSTQPGVHFWEQVLSVEALPSLSDPRVEGEVVVPGAAYMEIALAAAAEVYGEGARVLEPLELEQMVGLLTGGARIVQVVLTEGESGRATIQVSSREEGEKTWVRHATGSVGAGGGAVKTPSASSAQGSSGAGQEEKIALRSVLQAAAPSERRPLLEEFLSQQLSRVLRLKPSPIDPHAPLSRLGLDSLMTIELRQRVEVSLATPLPSMIFMQKGSVHELASYLLEQVMSESLLTAVADVPERSDAGEDWEIINV